MSQGREKLITQNQPCTWQPDAVCQDCKIKEKLQCRFEQEDLLTFFMLILPYAVTAISGVIRAGYGDYLFLWLAYSLFFFFIWEAKILCSHCPFWAENSHILHCHANYGVLKIWKFDPQPMNKSEKAQFILGALVWLCFPFPLLMIGNQTLLTLIAACAAVSAVFLLRRNLCSRCLNFSCPLNTVPDQLMESYLDLNPQIKKAWHSARNQSSHS
jgi:hypothetical protein